MFTYYVIYRDDERTRPGGIFIMDEATGAAILWSHRLGRWHYDPDLVGRFLNDYRNVDRYQVVERPVLEQLAQAITGGAQLPEQDAIRSMLEEGIRRSG